MLWFAEKQHTEVAQSNKGNETVSFKHCSFKIWVSSCYFENARESLLQWKAINNEIMQKGLANQFSS